MGSAGSVLVTAGLGAIGAEIPTITTSESNISLVCLVVEIVAVIIGCALMAAQKRGPAHAVRGGSLQHPREFTAAELSRIMQLCVSKTDLQLTAAQEYYGSWMRLTGRLDNVSRYAKGHSTVTLQEFRMPSGNFVLMQIADRYEVERNLARIARGTVLTITGKVTSIGASGIILGRCKIVGIGQGGDEASGQPQEKPKSPADQRTRRRTTMTSFSGLARRSEPAWGRPSRQLPLPAPAADVTGQPGWPPPGPPGASTALPRRRAGRRLVGTNGCFAASWSVVAGAHGEGRLAPPPAVRLAAGRGVLVCGLRCWSKQSSMLRRCGRSGWSGRDSSVAWPRSRPS